MMYHLLSVWARPDLTLAQMESTLMRRTMSESPSAVRVRSAYDMHHSTWDPNAPLGVAITLLGTRSAVIDCANANFAFTITGGALIGSAFSITGALSSLPSAACVCVCCPEASVTACVCALRLYLAAVVLRSEVRR